tara:strand:+ start:8691 stop:9233 length:543 start_codon:yes stop_codon:yes gene_type:complete
MLNDILRCLPFMIIIFEFINGISENHRESLLLSVGILLNNNSNQILKELIKNIFGNNLITSRPLGATNCKDFPDCSGILAKSMGMPSGHTQAIAFWAGFKLRKIFRNENDWKNRKLSIFGILFISIITGLGRLSGDYVGNLSTYYESGCHTPLQVIIGYLIGILLGWYYHIYLVYSGAIS